MDPIFDRLGRLFRSWTQGESPQEEKWDDPDMAEAWKELDEELKSSQSSRENEQRRKEKFSHQTKTSFANIEVQNAYLILEVPLTAPWDDIKKAHRRLLRIHHPDKHGQNPLKMKEATNRSQRINQAFQRIKEYLGK